MLHKSQSLPLPALQEYTVIFIKPDIHNPTSSILPVILAFAFTHLVQQQAMKEIEQLTSTAEEEETL
jgi:replication-associated recombination protein RarA